MVLKPDADSCEMFDDCYSNAAQFGLIADTGVQENLRRVYRSQRQNHLAPGTNATGASFMRNLDAGGSPTLESQPGNQRMREYREVWLVHVREDIRPEDGFALSIANADIGGGRTTIGLHDAAVLIFKDRNPERVYAVEQGPNGRCRLVQGLDEYRAARSAIPWIGRPMPVLDAPIDVENRIVAPCRVSGFRGKEVPIALVTTSPDHRVDARSAAQHLPHAHGNGAAVEVWVRLGLELPISLGADIRDPPAGIRDTLYVIVAPRFPQQHTHLPVFRPTAPTPPPP